MSRPGRGGGWGDLPPPEEFMVMRCQNNPERRLVHEYWPGAGGFGGSEKVVWTADAVTYFPSGFGWATVREHSFTLTEVERELQC
ncbi:hypothetical protein GCM10017783_14750 [Deinococcus piscis]|uniref:Uncharacterized protein n=1 Tax=Deinococcus piscis TaxID=394230 RepID=A0ABQ3K4Q8_9DEIO|nr:hypothetical protein [Deinococcus piscis]GHG03354.1 hypothetical protein GCM10017783_14750 [Deinococcus piscis]